MFAYYEPSRGTAIGLLYPKFAIVKFVIGQISIQTGLLKVNITVLVSIDLLRKSGKWDRTP